MMKKIMKIVYLCVLLLIIGVPVLTMPFISMDNGDASAENRNLAQFPNVMDEGSVNLYFFQEFDGYLMDHFNLRSQLVSLHTGIYEDVFGNSTNDQVIVGGDDWLYFSKTLDDYSGINVMGSLDVARVVKTLDLINEYAVNQGSEFFFTIAPNKNSLYPENMPANYLMSNNSSNLEMLSEKLPESYYINLYDALDSEEDILYLNRDSHWSNSGAYIGFNTIINKMGLNQSFNVVSTEERVDYKSDLDTMLYPLGGKLDLQTYYEFDSEFKYTSRFKTLDDLTITTTSETGVGRAIVYRDSFGEALFEFCANQFSELEYTRIVPYRIDKGVEYDYIILEIVERNLWNLLDGAPIMEGVSREIPIEAIKWEDLVIETDESNGYVHIYGYGNLPWTENMVLYVETNGISYEAFPILESKLEVEDTYNGFSVYINKDNVNLEDIAIYHS